MAVRCVSGGLLQQCYQHELSRTNSKCYLFIDIYKNAWYTLEGEVALSSFCVREGRPGQKGLFLHVVWVLSSHSFLTSSALRCLSLCRARKSSNHRFPKLQSVFPTAIKGDNDSGDNYTSVLWKWLVGWRSSGKSIGGGWMLGRVLQGWRPLGARCCSAGSRLGMCRLDCSRLKWPERGRERAWCEPARRRNRQRLVGRRGNCLSNPVRGCVKWQPTKNLSAW